MKKAKIKEQQDATFDIAMLLSQEVALLRARIADKDLLIGELNEQITALESKVYENKL